MVQIYANLYTEEQAIKIMVVWELLSLADFMDTDHDEVPWYSIPSVVRTYLTSSMDADEKKQLHAQFAEVIQENFYKMIQDALKANKEPVYLDSQDEFGTVLKYLPFFLQHPDSEYAQHYLEVTSNWQKHFREAGLIGKANKIVLAFIGILHDFGNFTATDAIIKTVRESGKLSTETDFQIQYWSAVRLIDEREYAKATKIMDALENQTKGKVGLELLHANVLERQGEIFRGLGDPKRADKIWIQALDEYERINDRLGAVRILFYFAEQSYYNKELDKAQSRLEKALNLLYQGGQTGQGIQLEGKLVLYLGHIARLQNKGAEAINHYTVLCRIGIKIGDGSLIAQGLEHMGYYYGLLKQYEIASLKLLQALDLYEKLNDQTGLSIVLMKLAVIQNYQGNAKEAYTFCQRSHRIAQKHALAHLKDVESLLKQLKNKAG